MTAELTKKTIERYDRSVPKAQYEIMKIPNSEECYDLFSLSSERVSSFYQTVDSIIKNHSELEYLTWAIDSNDIIIQKNVILGTPSTVLVPYGKDSDNEKKRKNIAQNIDLTIVDYPLMEEWHNLKSELKIDLNFIILFNRWQGLARGIKSTPITNLGGNILPTTKGWLSDIPWLKHFQGISESVCLQREYNPYMSKAGTVALLLENEYPGHARYTILRPLVLALMNITITEHESKFRDYAEIYNWILSLQNCIDSDRNFIDYVEIVYEWKFGVNPKAPPEDYLPEILRPEDIIRACTLKAIPINDLIRISISLGFEENHQKYKSVWETLYMS